MKNVTTILKKLAACLLLLAMLPAFGLAEFKATVYTSTMPVYESASTKSKYLGKLKNGTTVTVLSTSGDWCQVKNSKGSIGWTKIEYLKSTVRKQKYTTAQTKIYKTASTSGKTLTTVTADYPLYVVGQKGNFYLVENPANTSQTGYVLKSKVSDSRKNPYEVDSSSKISYSSSGSSTTMPSSVKSSQYAVASNMSKSKYVEHIIYAAQCKLGCKYNNVPNGSTTFNNGKFVSACFAVLNYKISSDVQQLGHKGKYTTIARASLKRGDIVCFDCDGTDDKIVDHVGIYLGKGYFIHASAKAGCVVVSNMSSGYYYNCFCWGRRVISY